MASAKLMFVCAWVRGLVHVCVRSPKHLKTDPGDSCSRSYYYICFIEKILQFRDIKQLVQNLGLGNGKAGI